MQRAAADDVEQQIAAFWRRIDALQPSDYVSSADLGQWALFVIARNSRARLTVADFRVATAAMQSSLDSAGAAPVAATSAPPVTPAPVATPTPSAIVARLGTFVTYTDGWRIEVLRTEPQAPAQYSTPKPGLQYLAVIVRYDNGTAAQQSFNPYDWKLQDSTGVRRDVAFFLGDRADTLHSGQLAPGAFVQGSIVFEMPVGDTRLSAIYDRYSYKVATWLLY